MTMAAVDAGLSLRWLLAPWADESVPDVAIRGMALDTRRLQPGELFVALPGTSGHGLSYIGEALRAGAVAVAWDPETAGSEPDVEAAHVPLVAVPGLARHLGAVAARLYGDPSRALELVAVTGTDGKSSVSHFVAQLFSEPDARWGVVGTLGHGLVDQLAPGHLTTPDAAALQRTLAACRDAGATGVALEASSHALAQGRLAGTAVDIAVLTHLGHDHLDYHGSAEAYADAKARLFELPGLRAQVLNIDDALGQRLHERATGAAFTYSAAGAEADLAAEGIAPTADGVALTVRVGGLRRALQLPLIGRFNVANALAAAGAAIAAGRPLETVLDRLAELRPVPGRMECCRVAGAPLGVVDYAHTPGALAHALEAVREHTRGRLTVVLGCGGERDRGKRPLMGETAARRADRVIITDDNPRGEPADRIRDEIAAGAGASAEIIPGRAEAIRAAFATAGEGDAVLVAGKGHEAEQEIDGVRWPLSDRVEVARALGCSACAEEGLWTR